MKLPRRKPRLTLLLVIALLALLPLLAARQYHWIGEISKGERERMKSNLQMSASQFCQDFDREVKSAYFHFQAGGNFFSDQSDAEFLSRYHRWFETSAHHRLVREIYQTQTKEGENYQLARFNPETGLFESCEWPEMFGGLRKAIEQQRVTRDSAQMILRGVFKQNVDSRIEKNASAAFIHLSLGPIDNDIPALVIPILDFLHTPDPGKVTLPAPRAYRIVTFDLDYIKRDFIPELAKKYFSHGGSSEYNIVVVKRDDPKQIIYESDAGLPANFAASGDVSENLFKVNITEADRMLFTRGLVQQGQNTQISRSDDDSRGGKKRIVTSLVQNDLNQFWVGTGNRPQELPRPVFRLSGEGYWQVVVKHHAGSLEAAVAGARRRNLAISFGILLLLGASVGLIVLSSRRAQKLGAQQMEFVAAVSHELRTPLAVICSAGENLADGVIDNREQIARYGSLIRDEGRRLTEMVENVLEFAGAQSGRKKYELRPVELSLVIDEAVAACHLQIVKGGFEIEKKIDANLPMVSADAAALSCAVQNLLSNAIKYSGESHWLGLVAEKVMTPQGVEVQIKISDRGLGIFPSELPYIFEPFYRGKKATGAQIHGNGMGLSLVKHIVEAHGGRVSVESKVGQGSSFLIRLPYDQTCPSD